jgi:diguanylate cyclase (GGDEF)-like protein
MLAGSDSTSTIKPLWVQALVASAEPMIQEARAAQTLRTGMDLDAFLEAVPVALCLEDWRENQIICLNARALAFWGQTLAGKRFSLAFAAGRVYPLDRPAYQGMRHQVLAPARGSQAEATLRMRDAAGEWRWMSCWLTVLSLTPSGLPERVLWSLQDITANKRLETQLRQAMHQDALTGLYNRAYFDAELARLDGGRQYPVGIIMMDVDTLKTVNDTHGHAAGDNLLQRLGAAIKDSFRRGDVVARLGGDEFAVLLPRSDERIVDAAVKRIERQVQRANLAAAGSKVAFGSSRENAASAPLAVSIGTAVARQGQPLALLLKQADQRMYQQKASRKARRSMRRDMRR